MKGKCTYFCQLHINIKYVYIFVNRGGKRKTRIYNDYRFTANRDSNVSCKSNQGNEGQ